MNTHAPIVSPNTLKNKVPATQKALALVEQTQKNLINILNGIDNRLIIIVGPCSIHDDASCIEYAKKLISLRTKYQDKLEIIMRAYFEKPRTTVGWKGLINDPNIDGSFQIEKGLTKARQILNQINTLGMPTATEFLDLLTFQYIQEFISWAAIGARTTESQPHRQLASTLDCPVGFKNNTNGDVEVATHAIMSASQPHSFLSSNDEGKIHICHSQGNPNCHIILRGGTKPNYDAQSVNNTFEMLKKHQQSPKLMIDLSHANSDKQFDRQIAVGQNVANQIQAGAKNIKGVMIESHLIAGKQATKKPLTYGQSITDGCLSFDDTQSLIEYFASQV